MPDRVPMHPSRVLPGNSSWNVITTKCSETTRDGKKILRETRLVTVPRFTDDEVECDGEAIAMATAAMVAAV